MKLLGILYFDAILALQQTWPPYSHLTISVPNVASWPLFFSGPELLWATVMSRCRPQPVVERTSTPDSKFSWVTVLTLMPEAHVWPSRLFRTFLAHGSVMLTKDSKGPIPQHITGALDSLLSLSLYLLPRHPWHQSCLNSSLGPHIIWCHFWHPGSLVLVRNALRAALSFSSLSTDPAPISCPTRTFSEPQWCSCIVSFISRFLFHILPCFSTLTHYRSVFIFNDFLKWTLTFFT